jgi:hypothetical protein
MEHDGWANGGARARRGPGLGLLHDAGQLSHHDSLLFFPRRMDDIRVALHLPPLVGDRTPSGPPPPPGTGTTRGALSSVQVQRSARACRGRQAPEHRPSGPRAPPAPAA